VVFRRCSPAGVFFSLEITVDLVRAWTTGLDSAMEAGGATAVGGTLFGSRTAGSLGTPDTSFTLDGTPDAGFGFGRLWAVGAGLGALKVVGRCRLNFEVGRRDLFAV
jgi:hypothetical protein